MTPENALQQIRLNCRFKYIDVGEEAKVLHLIHFGSHGWIAVVGHPDDAAYEWVVQPDSEFVRQYPLPSLKSSNCGYGGTTSALLDGLIAAEGCPQIDRLVVALRQADAEIGELCREIEKETPAGTSRSRKVQDAIRESLAEVAG